jgi:hypothetical protein
MIIINNTQSVRKVMPKKVTATKIRKTIAKLKCFNARNKLSGLAAKGLINYGRQ